MKNRESVFTGGIAAIRAVEDSIRATRKYTEGVGTMSARHPAQGAEFPSKMFVKYYEVYPDVAEVSWDMPVGVALDLLWKDTPCIDVLFRYDYRVNKAAIIVKAGDEAVHQLGQHIPGFQAALTAVINPPPTVPAKTVNGNPATYRADRAAVFSQTNIKEP